MSTGLATLASGATAVRMRAWVSFESVGIWRPSSMQASVARMAGPPELVMMATRVPAGMGWLANADA